MTTAQGTNPTNDEGAEGEIVPEAFSEYREHEPETPGVHDESVTDDAELRPDYAAVIERIETLGPDEVSRRLEAAGTGLTMSFPPTMVLMVSAMLVLIALGSGFLSLGVLKKSQPADLLR